MKTMTPLEIYDYKRTWLPGVEIVMHSDVHDRVRDWAKANLAKAQWDIVKWTNVYEHTIRLENENDATNLLAELDLEPFLSRQ
jgi:hypothetical protein